MSQATNQPDPILILQMQRMGDLLLSYPLCAWLASAFPGVPVWMVGEKIFFDGLIDISPPVTYFDYADSAMLQKRDFSLVINLSHRREAAILAGSLRSNQIIGPYINEDGTDGALRISGNWQLYRSSITANNRHNLFHWADLNAMDLISELGMLRTNWPVPKTINSQNIPAGRIGLFVGASEPNKRPDPSFWAGLASRLLRLGARPVLLGGHADAPLAAEAAQLLGSPLINMCGKFSIKELSLFMRELDLLIVPDTGPMHLAVWLGVPVLNLSMGPVNAWETGPSAPGHLVMRSTLSCVGCWQCHLPGIPCKRGFTPDSVARVVEAILQGGEEISQLELPGNALWLTDRDEHGLFNLRPLTDKQLTGRPTGKDRANLPSCSSGCSSAASPSCSSAASFGWRLDRSRFWKQFFLLALGRLEKNSQHLDKLAELAAPLHNRPLGKVMLNQGQVLLLSLNRELRGSKPGTTRSSQSGTTHSGQSGHNQSDQTMQGGQSSPPSLSRHAALLDPQFWQNFLPIFRPLSSYTQLYLQNAEFSRPAFAAALENLELFVNSLRK